MRRYMRKRRWVSGRLVVVREVLRESRNLGQVQGRATKQRGTEIRARKKKSQSAARNV